LNLSVLDDDGVATPPEIVISPAQASAAAVTVTEVDPITRQGSPASSVNSKDDLLPQPTPGTALGGLPNSEEGEATSESREVKAPTSQTSEETKSSADTLTRTALASVPTQLSSVVLSYRTNEWAKHITMADEPIYDEPESIDATDELPTQLVPVVEESKEEATKAQPMVEVPPAETLPPTVKAGGAGVGIVAKPISPPRSLPDQEPQRTGMRTSPSRSTSSHSLRQNRGHRSSLNAAMQNSLVSTPIDEDAPTEFTRPKRSSRRSSAPYPVASGIQGGSRSPIAQTPTLYTSMSTHNVLYPSRPSTQQSHRSNTPSGTRMDAHNAHLPQQRNLQTDAQKRESLLADWRLSQQHRAASTGLGSNRAEQGRAQMKAEKDHQRLVEDFQRAQNQQKQLAMDQMMRRPDVQDLHREAMRKMQAGANKKLNPSSG
jgi:hypothetical protein